MSQDAQNFVRDLFRIVHEGRAFGRHPLWLKIAGGGMPRDKLRIFAAQFFLQVREFPRALSAMHSKCTDSAERLKLAESLYEEETGLISGSAPHPELFIRLGRGLGMKREEMTEAEPLPTTAALIDWFEVSTRDRSLAEGIAAINVAAEGQVPGNFASFARALEKHYGLRREEVVFFDVHEIADKDHSEVGDNILTKLPLSQQQQSHVKGAVMRSLAMWWLFFDGLQRAMEA